MAALIRGRTAASTEWIAKRLQMGHPGSVSRQVGIVKRDKKLLKKLNELEKMCHCGDWYHFHAVRSRRASLIRLELA